jgi:Ca-activated chloride channel homolog
LLSRLDGHRVGLVAFAGSATVLAPLTPDYGFFRMILGGTSPLSVSRGGTRIGDAIRTSLRAFDRGPGSKILLLITDGEDHESHPEEAAERAAELGVRIIAIGFGSEEGSPIRVTDPDTGARETVTDDSGNPVISRLDGELLRQLVLKTDGAFVPAGTAALDLESIVTEHVEPIVRVSAEERRRRAPNEHYPWLVLATLIGLLSVTLLSTPPSNRAAARPAGATTGEDQA